MYKEEKDFLDNLQYHMIKWDIEDDKKLKAKRKSKPSIQFQED